jgi:hypothetical protein
MDRRRLSRGLVALNVGLAITLLAVSLAPAASAQRGVRARGEYALLSGKSVGGNSHSIFVIDAANQEMVAMKWNESTKGLDGIGYRDLSADINANPGR